jgi:two-component system OmpR family sensor kinase
MSRLPIRLRLTAIFVVAMAVVLTAAGAFVYQRLASDLARALDQELRLRAQDLSALVAREGSLRATGRPLLERGESFAELLADDGRVVDATAPIGHLRLISAAQLQRARTKPIYVNRGSAPGLDEPARMLALPLAPRGRRLILVVGATRENRAETLNSLRTGFLIGGPVVLLLASIAGYLLAGAALRPIEAMRRRAAEISTASLDERLPVPQARDEVSRLGETLNEMLARLEGGLARERRFVADASHELRTPLALLKTELELALSRARSPGELEQAIRSAAESTERLTSLADDLLLLARAQEDRVSLQPERTDLADVFESVARSFAGRAEAEERQVVVDGVEPLVISADRLRLEQALRNMIDNGLRHGRGNVTLTAHARDGTAELHVLDEGPGFPDAFLARAFDRFSRADPTRSDGSGLGLAIVSTVARAHGGEAHAANRPNGGADVWLALPLRCVR